MIALSIIFCVSPGNKIKLEEVEKVDAPYIALLKNKYLDTITIPTEVLLQTLGEYISYATAQTDNKFGLTSKNGKMDDLFTNDKAKVLLSNSQFTQQKSEHVVLASPLWAYYHNLHLHEATYCTDAQISTAMTSNKNSINSVLPVTPAISASVYKCLPAHPTTIDYRRCYDDHTWQRHVMLAYIIPTSFLFIVSTIFYYFRAQTEKQYLGLLYTPYIQQFSLAWHIVAVLFITITVSYSGFHTEGVDSRCPDKMTGLGDAYTILLVFYIGLYFVICTHVCAMVYEYKGYGKDAIFVPMSNQ